MRKALLALLMTGGLMAPAAVFGTETLHKASAIDGIERYLPPVTTQAPWLNLDRRTKLPKGDYPIGRDGDSGGPLLLRNLYPQQADLAESALSGGS